MRQYVEQLKLREKYYIPPDNKVQNFLAKPLLEGSTEAAKEMEFVLVDAAGGSSGKKAYKNLEPYATKNGFDTSLDLGKTP